MNDLFLTIFSSRGREYKTQHIVQIIKFVQFGTMYRQFIGSN